jgi:molybdopterin converting factor small subunit
MAIIVRIPTPLQKFTKKQSEIQAEGATVQAVLDHLDRSFPGFGNGCAMVWRSGSS